MRGRSPEIGSSKLGLSRDARRVAPHTASPLCLAPCAACELGLAGGRRRGRVGRPPRRLAAGARAARRRSEAAGGRVGGAADCADVRCCRRRWHPRGRAHRFAPQARRTRSGSWRFVGPLALERGHGFRCTRGRILRRIHCGRSLSCIWRAHAVRSPTTLLAAIFPP